MVVTSKDTYTVNKVPVEGSPDLFNQLVNNRTGMPDAVVSDEDLNALFDEVPDE